jgi:hypothetical protein
MKIIKTKSFKCVYIVRNLFFSIWNFLPVVVPSQIYGDSESFRKFAPGANVIKHFTSLIYKGS